MYVTSTNASDAQPGDLKAAPSVRSSTSIRKRVTPTSQVTTSSLAKVAAKHKQLERFASASLAQAAGQAQLSRVATNPWSISIEYTSSGELSSQASGAASLTAVHVPALEDLIRALPGDLAAQGGHMELLEVWKGHLRDLGTFMLEPRQKLIALPAAALIIAMYWLPFRAQYPDAAEQLESLITVLAVLGVYAQAKSRR
ncbi:hypothetical protein Cme02nite_26340 [Catellatospora methionotrophica]|uniref:Uncharacterized protein n=1 Tax=Catellatospora methionotrophica TaxID=121620 RepID=A0A8J3L8K9_9ACTN|nr:hypothetical protein [Catellatospora methionotrophica]GIG14302.1 hypothetical protein Cme02nite_26340 [Catellatospora methionotrophica]